MDCKRSLALCLALLLCLWLALPALAAEDDFVIVDETLQEYHGPGGRVVIPDGVRWLGNGVFAWRDDITDVVFPEELLTIGECAFYKCHALTEVTIPQSVAFIGSSAFYNCSNLQKVVGTGADNDVTHRCHIYANAFAQCISLSDVTFPNTTFIEDSAFQNTPWQSQQDRQAPLPLELVRLLVCVALVAVAAVLIMAHNKKSKS